MKPIKRTFTQDERTLVFDLWKQGAGFSDISRIIDAKPSDKAQKHTELAHHVKEAYEVFKARYGAPRLTYELKCQRCSV